MIRIAIFLFLFITLLLHACSGTKTDKRVLSPDTLRFVDGRPVVNQVLNGDFEYWSNDSEPLGWEVEAPFFTSKLEKNDSSISGDYSLKMHFTKIRSEPILVHQTIPVDPNTFYTAKVKVNYKNDSWYFGGLTIKGKENNHVLGHHHFTHGTSEKWHKELSVKFNSGDHTEINYILGFEECAKANIYFDDARLLQSAITEERYEAEIAGILKEKLNLDDFDSANYHQNIVKIGEYVNSNLCYPLHQVYQFKGAREEKEKFLIQKQDERAEMHKFISTHLPGSWFGGYLKLPILETGKAYCQKSSLSTTDILSALNIPTRQLHMHENNAGFHQFFEYWHPFQEKWIAFDPYYGISYRNEEGRLLGYNELAETKKRRPLNESDIEKYDIIKAGDVDSILVRGWHSGLKFHQLRDSRTSYVH